MTEQTPEPSELGTDPEAVVYEIPAEEVAENDRIVAEWSQETPAES